MTALGDLFLEPWFWALVAIAVAAGIAGLVGLHSWVARRVRADDYNPYDPERSPLRRRDGNPTRDAGGFFPW